MFRLPAEPGIATRQQGLVIGKPKEARLSKAQREFNRLTRRIESLRREIMTTQTRIDQHLAFYVSDLRPLEEEIGRGRAELVTLLFPFLSRREFGGKRVRGQLRRLISAQLHGVMNTFGELQSPELRSIFQAVNGRTIEEASQEDFESARDQMQDFCNVMGMDVDLSGFHWNMTKEDLAQRFAEFGQRLANSDPPHTDPQARKKSKRALDLEARERAAEEMRIKDLGRLYKGLAKILHPDLEQDSERRKEKEAAMKRLTTAYKDRDLHTMLRLEAEWIAREQADASRLTNDKLTIYNSVLKEQVVELEEELGGLAGHPRYDPLHRLLFPAGLIFRIAGAFDRKGIKQKLHQILDCVRRSVGSLQSHDALAEVKSILKEFADEEAQARVNQW